jgi:hypothetical protein
MQLNLLMDDHQCGNVTIVFLKTKAWIHALFSKYFGLNIIENQLGEFDLILRNKFQII